MTDKKTTTKIITKDGRKSFRGYTANPVAGGKRPVTTYLEPETFNQLIAFASATSSGVASVVSQALTEFVARQSVKTAIAKAQAVPVKDEAA